MGSLARASSRLRTRPSRICVLASGGVESAALLSWALRREREVYPVYVACGFRWERAELHWLTRLLRRLRRPVLRPLTRLRLDITDCYDRSHWSLSGRAVPGSRSPDAAVHLPGRNILLLSRAAVFCAVRGIGRIAMGPLRANPFPDAGPAFLRGMARTLSAGLRRPIRILAPFARRKKDEVLESVRGVPWELTFSCLSPVGKSHCGRCNKCAERGRAFAAAGIADRTS
ncbi:MAG: 7-cyano-7-deazaguanine synthase [Elusimicrobiota bacterium]